MKGYAIIDRRKSDGFETELKAGISREEAIKEADRQWGYLTKNEQAKRDEFYLVYGEFVEDDYGCVDYSGEIIKDYKEG